jgi:hypothetical protein
MSDLTRVVPLDLDAVDVSGVADHNAGRFPTAQTDMGAERESGRVWALSQGRLGRLGHGPHAFLKDGKPRPMGNGSAGVPWWRFFRWNATLQVNAWLLARFSAEASIDPQDQAGPFRTPFFGRIH